MRNQRTDFPTLTCAVSCLNGEYRASIGARPNKAQLCRDVQHLVDGAVTAENAKAFAAYAAKNTSTGKNIRGSAAYRTHLVKVLTERSMMELGGM